MNESAQKSWRKKTLGWGGTLTTPPMWSTMGQGMLLAFFESFKYAGHLYPLAVMRVALGYFYFSWAMAKIDGDFLLHPILAEQINQHLASGGAPAWYQNFLQNVVDFNTNWQILAYSMTYLEFLIGMSLMIGFLVRPIALFGSLLCLHQIYMQPAAQTDFYQLLLVSLVTLSWLGGGRCLGFDYFFYKRQRGIWW